MQTAYTNLTIYSGNSIIENATLLVKNNVIDGIVNNNEVPEGYTIKNCEGLNIAPAFIDLQLYGGNGKLFSAQPSFEAIEATNIYCKKGGCNHFLLAVATNSKEVFYESITVAKKYLQLSHTSGFMGLHLEGPWINTEKRGAHQPQFIHAPSTTEVKELLQHAAGVVKMITLAPEIVSEEIIDLLQENGIVVSAGHTNANYKIAKHSFKKIKTVTHLFNAMSPLQGRNPGVVGAVYDDDKVCSSVVADGFHVDFASIRISKKIMKERLFLITDAVTETVKGPYQHQYKDGRYVMPDGTLSGSTLTMMQAVKNCFENKVASLEECLRMASTYPAQLMQWNDLGKIEKGYKASLVFFDKTLNVIDVT